MADITDNCTFKVLQVDGVKHVKVTTPSDASNGDTVDLSDYYRVNSVAVALNSSDGTNLCQDAVDALTATLPGSASSEERVLFVWGY